MVFLFSAAVDIVDIPIKTSTNTLAIKLNFIFFSIKYLSETYSITAFNSRLIKNAVKIG
jgi:hypothetical protein